MTKGKTMSDNVTNAIVSAMASFLSHPGDVRVPQYYLGDLIHDGAHIARLVGEGVTSFVWVLRTHGTHIAPDRALLSDILSAFGPESCALVCVSYDSVSDEATCRLVSDIKECF